VILHHLTLKHN